MSTDAADLKRTIELMERLSGTSRKVVRELVDLLADREDLDETLDQDEMREDRELFERVAAGDLSGTVTLEEAKRLVLGPEREQPPCSR